MTGTAASDMTSVTVSTSRLAPRHVEVFERSAVPLAFAEEVGCFTVETAADLPDDLSAYHWAPPGFVVPLRTVRGEIVHQIRRDSVPAGTPKCLQPEDSGSVITVHPQMVERVGVARRILVVEGTRQALAASAHAPADTLVVGLQGCNGWSSQGTPHADLALLGVKGAEVVLLFDADYASNLRVFEASLGLAGALSHLGAAKVRYGRFTGSGSTGLDDYLGMSVPPGERTEVLGRIMDQAPDKPGRKPAAKLKRPEARPDMACDMARGVTVVPAHGDVPESVVMEAAGRIVEAITVVDPDSPERHIPPQLRVEMALPTPSGVATYGVEVGDDRLHDIGMLLGATRSGIALSVARPTGYTAEREIANAIRLTERDATIHSLAYRRLGWVVDAEGTYRYLHTTGAIGPADTVRSLRAWMPSGSRCIAFTDPGLYTAEQMCTAVRASLDNRDSLVDSTPWLAILGTVGIAPSGVVPMAAVALVGPPSSGKSALLQTATAFLSPDFAYERRVMSTADATPTSIDLALTGHDNSLVLLDDFHPEVDQREQARQVKVLDAALRRAHGAPSKGRGTIANNTVEQAAVNESHPVVLLSLEQLPPAAKSGIDRALTIEVTRASTFRQGEFPHFAAAGQSGQLQLAYAGYLRWLAQRVATGPSDLATWLDQRELAAWPSGAQTAMREWRAYIEHLRGKFVSKVSERVPEATSRAAKVVASLTVGITLWLDFAVSIEALSTEKADSLSREALDRLTAAVDSHTQVAMAGNLSAVDDVMEAIRSAVASGKATLGEFTPGGAIRIGKFTTVDGGVKVVALNTGVRIPGVPPGWHNTLKSVCLAESSTGKAFRQIRIGEAKPRCAVIPVDVIGVEAPEDERF